MAEGAKEIAAGLLVVLALLLGACGSAIPCQSIDDTLDRLRFEDSEGRWQNHYLLAGELPVPRSESLGLRTRDGVIWQGERVVGLLLDDVSGSDALGLPFSEAVGVIASVQALSQQENIDLVASLAGRDIEVGLSVLRATNVNLRVLRAYPGVRRLSLYAGPLWSETQSIPFQLEPLGDEIFEEIAHVRDLESLAVRRFSSIHGEGIRRLRHLHRLEELELTGAELSQLGCDSLGELRGLRALRLVNSEIPAACFVQLPPRFLRGLRLLTSTSAMGIERFRNLERLRVHIGEGEWDGVLSLSRLRELSATSEASVPLANLARLPALRTLRLIASDFDVHGAQPLSLTKLRMSSFPMLSDSAFRWAFSHVGLVELHLNGNTTTEQLQSAVDAVTGLGRLKSFQARPVMPASFLCALAATTELEHLDISLDLVESEAMECLSNIRSLKRLRIIGRLSGALSPLRNLSNLRELEIGASADADDIRAISTLSGLRVLEFGIDRDSTNDDVAPLGMLRNLEYLSISGGQPTVHQNVLQALAPSRLRVIRADVHDLSWIDGHSELRQIALHVEDLDESAWDIIRRSGLDHLRVYPLHAYPRSPHAEEWSELARQMRVFIARRRARSSCGFPIVRDAVPHYYTPGQRGRIGFDLDPG